MTALVVPIFEQALHMARQLAANDPPKKTGKGRENGREFTYAPADEILRVGRAALPGAGLFLRALDATVSSEGLTRHWRLTHMQTGATEEWTTTTPLDPHAAPDLAAKWARTHSLVAVLNDLLWPEGEEVPDPSERRRDHKPDNRTQRQIQEDERRAKNSVAPTYDRNERPAPQEALTVVCNDRPFFMPVEKVNPPDTTPLPTPDDLPVFPPRGATEPKTEIVARPDRHPGCPACNGTGSTHDHATDQPAPATSPGGAPSPAPTLWRVTTKGDQEARTLFDGHYSRQTPGSPHWLRPGFNYVLRHDDAEGRIDALFVWWRPKWEAGLAGTERKDGLRVLECTVFRRMGGPIASELVCAAEAALLWPEARAALHLDEAGPIAGLLTGVSSSHTAARRSVHSLPGECFRRAGWVESSKVAPAGSRADVWLERPWPGEPNTSPAPTASQAESAPTPEAPPEGESGAVSVPPAGSTADPAGVPPDPAWPGDDTAPASEVLAAQPKPIVVRPGHAEAWAAYAAHEAACKPCRTLVEPEEPCDVGGDLFDRAVWHGPRAGGWVANGAAVVEAEGPSAPQDGESLAAPVTDRDMKPEKSLPSSWEPGAAWLKCPVKKLRESIVERHCVLCERALKARDEVYAGLPPDSGDRPTKRRSGKPIGSAHVSCVEAVREGRDPREAA